MSNLRRRKSGSPSIIDKVPSPSIAETNARKLQAKEKQKQVSTTPTSKDAIENTINLFDRISEACNVRLPKQTAESDPIESMGFQALHNEPEALRNLRFQLFKSSLHSITSIIEDTQSTINLSLIQHVVQFVENASKLFMEPENVDSSRPFLNRREIMTGLIFTGVNSHDHISTYDALVGSIARETRHKVAVLVPKNCTTIKNAVKRVVQQFVDETSEGWDSDEDEEAMSSRKIRKVPNYDMQGLLGWYQSSRREYTKEEETSQKGVPSLVLFIQDFELCDSRVLEQLIGVCCSYKDRLPIVLLFGIATSMETFHQVLSAGTISRLSTQNFKLQSPAECVESIIEKVFIQRKSGWKLGGDVLHTLLHRFWNYNSSVAELSRSIHLALLHFFYSNPLSIFCSPNTDIGANFNDAWNHINTDHLLNLQMCDSFRNHVLTLPAEKIAPLLSDTPNAEMKQFVFDALEGLDRYHERLRAGYECFRQFISLMDNYGKKAFRRFILAIQDGQVAKNDLGRKYIAHKDVKMLFGLFKRFPLESMSSYLSFLSTHLSLHSADYHENEITKVSELLEQITLLMGEQSREEDGDSDSDESIDGADNDESRSSPSAIDGVVANLGVNTPNGISNKKLRKLLSKEEEKASKNGRRNRRRKKETEESEAEELSLPERTEKFKTTATQFLEAYFSDVFQPYTTVLFHELYYWNDDRYLSKILTAQPRSTIQSVLNQPHDYLKCTCCDPKKIGANISPSLHDTSILYKLYQECGRMINLFDFFKAFESIVDREEAESGSQLGDGKEEPRIGRDENAVKRIKRKIVPRRNTRGRKKVQVGKGKGPSVDQDSDNENSFDTDEGDQGQSRPRKGQSELVTEQNVKFARFIKSLGELQFLGFVKPTTRKTDHVVRLTWGRV